MNRKTGGWVSVAIGVIFLIAGLVWGLLGTHQVSYENSQQGGKYLIGLGETSSNVYIHEDGSSEYFVALKADMSPTITQSAIDNSTSLNFIARTDTTSISLNVNNTTINEAHEIEKLVFLDKNGSVMTTYTTAEYNANPNGISVSAWSQAGWLAGLGLLLIILGIFSALRARKTNVSSAGSTSMPPYQPAPPAQPGTYSPTQPGTFPPAQPGAYPPTQPGAYPQANPYGQPNPGMQPYPQQSPYGQPNPGMQPQQSPYGQPNPGPQPQQNPYGQPNPGPQPQQNSYGQPNPGPQPQQNPYGQSANNPYSKNP